MQTTSWHSLRSARVRLCHNFCALPSAIVQPRASMSNHELERTETRSIHTAIVAHSINNLGGISIYLIQIQITTPRGLCLATRPGFQGSRCEINQSCLARPI
jgi:hypothetical protein